MPLFTPLSHPQNTHGNIRNMGEAVLEWTLNEHSGVTWTLCFPWKGKYYSNTNRRVNSPHLCLPWPQSWTSPGLPEPSSSLSSPALAVHWAPWITPKPSDSRHSPSPTWLEEAEGRSHGLREAHFSLPVPIFLVMLQAFLAWQKGPLGPRAAICIPSTRHLPSSGVQLSARSSLDWTSI